MGIYHQVGGVLVDQNELILRAAEFEEAAARGGGAGVRLSTGTLIPRPMGPAAANVEFDPIGINRPLTVEIRSVYLGEEPTADFLNWNNQDLLLTSAVKGMQGYDGAPRAINYIKPDVRKFTLFQQVPASSEGTFVVFHTPALADYSTTVTLEMAFNDSFKEFADAFAGVAQAAAGLPVFAPAAGYLLGAGVLLRLVGRTVDLLRRRSAVALTEEIIFARPGFPESLAGFKVLLRDAASASAVLHEHDVRAGVLVNRTTGQPYRGKHPHIVLSVDGHPRPDLADFQPRAAAADVLDRFFGKADAARLAIDEIGKGLEFYNDFTLRTRAEGIAGRWRTEPDPARKQALADQYAAIRANIRNPELRPPALG